MFVRAVDIKIALWVKIGRFCGVDGEKSVLHSPARDKMESACREWRGNKDYGVGTGRKSAGTGISYL